MQNQKVNKPGEEPRASTFAEDAQLKAASNNAKSVVERLVEAQKPKKGRWVEGCCRRYWVED